MDRRSLALIIYKALGIYFLVKGLIALPSSSGINLAMPFFGLQIVILFWPLLVHLIIGFLLYFQTDLFLPKEIAEETESPANIDGAEIQFIIFTLIGLYLLVSAVPAILSLIAILLTKTNNPEYNVIYLKYLNPYYITTTIVEFIIGTWLLLGSRGMVNFIRKLRYAGLDSDIENREEK